MAGYLNRYFTIYAFSEQYEHALEIWLDIEIVIYEETCIQKFEKAREIVTIK